MCVSENIEYIICNYKTILSISRLLCYIRWRKSANKYNRNPCNVYWNTTLLLHCFRARLSRFGENLFVILFYYILYAIVVKQNLKTLFVSNYFLITALKVVSTEKEWKYWCDTESPEEEDIPCGYQQSLDVFRSIIIQSISLLQSVQQSRLFFTCFCRPLGWMYTKQEEIRVNNSTLMPSSYRTHSSCNKFNWLIYYRQFFFT